MSFAVNYADGKLAVDGAPGGAPRLEVGAIYIFVFDVSSATMKSKKFKLSTTHDGEHTAGGEEYLNGVMKAKTDKGEVIEAGTEGASVSFFLAKDPDTPLSKLYYYLGATPGAGNAADSPMMIDFTKFGLPSAICAAGHMGPLCSVCEGGWAMLGGASLCTECSGDPYMPILYACIALVVFSFLLYGGYKFSIWFTKWQRTHADSTGASAFLNEAHHNGQTYIMKWKIIVRFVPFCTDVRPGSDFVIHRSFYQIIETMGTIFTVPFPAVVIPCMGWFRVLNFDFMKYMSTGCAITTDFFHEMIINTMVPLTIIAGLLLQYKLNLKYVEQHYEVTEKYKVRMYATMMTYILAILYFIYPNICKSLFQVFQVKQYEDGELYLIADMSISPSLDPLYYNTMVSYAVVFIMVFPLGTIALFGWVGL
jgi:hypothetical protein